MANRILTDLQLWPADRSSQIALPSGVTFDNCMSSVFRVKKTLGKPWSANFDLHPGSTLSVAVPSDSYFLQRKRIIRLVYDDATIEEWRIKKAGRQFSGESSFKVELEPVWQDLAYLGLRQTLSTGDVRTSVSFFGNTVDEILTSVLSSTYNCPDLFTKGVIDATIGAKEIRLSLNGVYLIDALKEIANAAEAEWDVSYDVVNDDYEINYYQIGGLGGGILEAPDRPVEMGATRGNRENMLMQTVDEDFFSRIQPIAGSGNETRGIGDITFTATAVTSDTTSVLTIDRDLILEDGFPITSEEVLYFGNSVDGWNEVTATDASNQRITITGNIGAISTTREGRFGLGTPKKKLTTLEDPTAISDIGVVEQTYRRTDIPIYENVIKAQDISDDMSSWSSGLPVGVVKIGTPIVEEESGDQYVKFGSKSAKVRTDSDQGIKCSVTIDNTYPYFSLISYLYIESGSVKLEFVDSAGNLVPEGQFAETNVATIQGLALQSAQPASGVAEIKITALENGTVFYLDGWVLANSASTIQFAPLMGIYDLWSEAGKELILNGGIQGNEYTGSFWDASYDEGGLKETDIGTWVRLKDGFNPTTSAFGYTEDLRVIECSYVEEFYLGRRMKKVKLSNRPKDLNNYLSSTYVSVSSVQEGNDVTVVDSLNALEKFIKDGNLILNSDGTFVLINTGKITNSNDDFTISSDGINFDYDTTATAQKSISWGTADAFLQALSSGGGFLEAFAHSGVRLQQDNGSGGIQTPYQMDLTAHFFSLLPFFSTHSEFYLTALPTSAPAESNRLWNDSGTVKIT